jgi:hypothetical protein
MDPVAIKVRAVQGGWTVESGLLGAPLMFLSGARAERQAHRLAQALSRIGRDVQVAVHDRLDALIAQIELRAAAPAPANGPVTTTAAIAHAARPWVDADLQRPPRWRPRAPLAAAFGSTSAHEALVQARRDRCEMIPA